MVQYVASLSYGKDSMAMIHVIKDILHQPLDRIVTADVWATDTIPAELPPMVEFKDYADAEIKRRWGIEVEHVCAMKSFQTPPSVLVGGYKYTYENIFYTEIGNKEGRWAKRRIENSNAKCRNSKAPNQYIYGFPCQFGPWCNSKLKVAALDRIKKEILRGRVLPSEEQKQENSAGENIRISHDDETVVQQRIKDGGNKVFYSKLESEVVQYIGIASDEGERTKRHIEKVEKGLERLPLVEAGWTEQMCRDWCEKEGLLAPTYSMATRGGCWFCHNQSIKQLRILRRDYPDLWALLMKWDSDSPVTFRADGRTVHDIDRRLQWEDEGYMPTQKQFRWSDVENAQMNIYQFIQPEPLHSFEEDKREDG